MQGLSPLPVHTKLYQWQICQRDLSRSSSAKYTETCSWNEIIVTCHVDHWIDSEMWLIHPLNG